MKTSNILLTATGILILATLAAANMALKTEFEKGGYKDRFYNFETMPVADVKNISISVPGYLRVCVEFSDYNTLKYPRGWARYVEASVQGDSLRLHIKGLVPYRADTLYILLKELHSVSMTDRGRLKISRWQQPRLNVTAGKNSDIEFENTAIDSLEITGRDHSSIFTKEENRIGFLNLHLEDHAKFKAGDLEFSGLKTQIGPNSGVELMGRSLESFMENFQDQDHKSLNTE